MEQIPPSLSNATSFLPSSMDLLLAVPRLLQRAGSYAEHVDYIFGKIRYGGRIIAEPTIANMSNASLITSAGSFAQESLAAATSIMTGQDSVSNISPFQALRNIGGFFTYMTSKWAIATFTAAILLNRTYFYASSRIPLSLNRWHLRLTLYILPTILFIYRIQWILQAIRCQTSPNWTNIQYGEGQKALDIDFAGEGGFLWTLSSALLFWQDEEASCRAANMLPLDQSLPRPAGSLSLLWPLFISLGFSQFIETLSCALQSRQPLPETGMTIFEHSLAFAEAEAVVTKPFGFESARFSRSTTMTTLDGASLTLSRSAISQFANVPPEVLVISLISGLSHLTSNFLAILGVRSRFRLVNTSFWGLAYMSTFVWSFFRIADMSDQSDVQVGVLRFPTVCIVGFIPHLLILAGILACGTIYAIAFVLTVMYPPPGTMETGSLMERIHGAYRNLQANIHLSAITPLRINWQEDFYTAILKCGFTILTSASEAVYLNEGNRVTASPMTWLEEKRLQEAMARRKPLQKALDTIPAELRGDSIATGVQLVDHSGSEPLQLYQGSGYGRERKTRGVNAASEASVAVGRDTGVGIQQRRGRWTLTYQFFKGIFWLHVAILSKAAISVLRKLRITYRPAWLVRLAGPEAPKKMNTRVAMPPAQQNRPTRDFWLVDEDGSLGLSSDDQVDIEELSRRRLQDAGFYDKGSKEAETALNHSLYDWWKAGGWWGDVDNSGDYKAPSNLDDDDTTSMISTATTAATDNSWSDLSSGQRTPTQDNPDPYTRDSTPAPDHLIDTSRLAHLLDPQTTEHQEEARLLSRHLQSQGVLTRSQYRKSLARDQTRVLTSSRYIASATGHPTSNRMTAEQEEQLLEDFILARRQPSSSSTSHPKSAGGTWDSGAEGMGSDGPQCVVCQLSPRTVLVWPCGCLSLCDECRVGLASKNYTNCVCCRTNVVAYSRLYVP